MTAFRHLHIEERGEVALLRIQRPPANALNLELLDEAFGALTEIAAVEPGAVVITGTEGFFSAGLDLNVVPTLDRDDQRRVVEGINRLFAGWYAFPRPVICAVNGHAIAGGLILALCADHRIGAAEGRFGLTELRAGVPYPAVAMRIVQAELTPAAARQLALRAELYGPEQALELGLLDELSTGEAQLDRALEVAGDFAALPQSAYVQVKRQLRREVIEVNERIIRDGADPLLRSWLGEEAADAAAGILSGRPSH